eukprot:229564_1
MEMAAFLETFKWISDENNWSNYIQHAEGIVIVSDSQNCINVIAQRSWPKDDKIIQLNKLICDHLEVIKNMKLINNYIQIYWIHSHQQQQTINDDADEEAKAVALYLLTMYDNEYDPNLWFHPNDYIAYNSIKSR